VAHLTHARNSKEAAGKKSSCFFLKTDRTSPPAPGVFEHVEEMQRRLSVSPGRRRCEPQHADGAKERTARCNCGSLLLQDGARVAVAVEPAVRSVTNKRRNTRGANILLALK
jgi:hypothetical protein